MTTQKCRQKGIGLVEVLVAAVIFALGSLALVQLQGKFFKNSSAANARSIAMSVAQEKLEDLKGVAPTDGGFDSIITNAGGRSCTATDLPDDDATCTGTEPSRPNANVTKNNTIYTRSWTVANFYYNTSGSLLNAADCTTSSICGADTSSVPASPDQKTVAITIAWLDTDGSSQSLTLNGLLNSKSTAAGGALAADTGGSGESPEVPYTPSAEQRVTPISVGTSSKRETLVPTSEVVDGYNRTRFTAYTYNSSNILLREEEFRNVACECRFDGTSSVGSETYGPAYATWSTTLDSYEDITGELISGKVKGCVQGGGSNCDANPEEFCEICCNDHHDATSIVRKYDPYRSTDDFDGATGNHKHYDGTTVVTSGSYQESCRLKRVDGFWRVYQDWHSVNFEAIPLTDLSGATKATYASYVKDIIDAHLDESKVSGQTLTSPPAEPAAINHNTVANYVNMSVNDIAEISGRGLYLDYIDATHLAQVQAKKGASEDYLLHVPFYEVEVVEVTNWSSADDSIVAVGPVDNPGSSNDILVGEMKAEATDTNPVVISASLRKSNTGLTNMNVSLDYNAVTNPDSDEQTDSLTVCVGCSGASTDCTTPWSATVLDTNSVAAYLTSSVISPATCTSETRTCSSGTLSGSYTNASCSVITATDCPTPWGATVLDTQSVTAYLDATPTTSCTSETRTCSSGTLSGTYANDTCVITPVSCTTVMSGKKDAAADSISIAGDGGETGACPSSGKNYTCTISSPTTAVITVTSGGVPLIASTCISQSHNF